MNLFRRIQLGIESAYYTRGLSRVSREAGIVIVHDNDDSSNTADTDTTTTNTGSQPQENQNEASETREPDTSQPTNEAASNESNAGPIDEANMNGFVRNDSENATFPDFSFFTGNRGTGSQIDPKMMQNISQQQQNAYLDYLAAQQQAAEMNNRQQANPNGFAPPRGMGMHKVDNPQQVKKKPEKAPEDNVSVDLSNIIPPEVNEKLPREMPAGISENLPQAGPVEVDPTIPAFDNSAITSKRKYMAEIERIALDCGMQIQMVPQMIGNADSGLIRCFVYSPESQYPNQYKSFTIDTGVIIDRRTKLFPVIIDIGFEDIPSYEVMTSKDKENDKSKKVVNEELFRNIFIGGLQMLKPVKPTYSPDYMDLNKNVALITMPTNNMNRDTRHAVQDRLMSALKAHVFDSARKNDPNARFKFKNFNKQTLEFILTSKDVPRYYGGPVESVKEIELVFGADGKTILNNYSIPPKQ